MSRSVTHISVQRFGEKLRLLRKQAGMSPVELALALGYSSSSQISMLESGQRGASADLVRKVSVLFAVSADDLLDDARELPAP